MLDTHGHSHPAHELDAPQAAIEVVILWGDAVLSVAHLSPPRPYAIGSGDHAPVDFVVGEESLGCEQLPVVVAQGAGHALELPAGAQGHVLQDGQWVAVPQSGGALAAADGVRRLPLSLGTCAHYTYGGLTLFVRAVAAGRRPHGGGQLGSGARAHAWTLASLLVHAGLLLLFWLLPPAAPALSMDLLHREFRGVSAQLIPDSRPEPPKSIGGGLAGGEPAERYAGESGRAGERRALPERGRRAVRGQAERDTPVPSRERLQRYARDQGLVGLIRKQLSDSSLRSLFDAERAQGSDPRDALGALRGMNDGASFGFGGLGALGTGRGGGGRALDTVGVGGPQTKGAGGPGYGVPGGLPTRGARVPDPIRPGPVEVRGALSKETIRRRIRRQLSQIRFCYEQALVARPHLQGRVSIKFIISPSGSVSATGVVSSSLGDAKAERCIAAAVGRIGFPPPRGGGIVVVTYPFNLQPVGD